MSILAYHHQEPHSVTEATQLSPRQNQREAIEAVLLRMSETVNQQSSAIMSNEREYRSKPQHLSPESTEYLRPGDYRNLREAIAMQNAKGHRQRNQRPLTNCDAEAPKGQKNTNKCILPATNKGIFNVLPRTQQRFRARGESTLCEFT